MENKGTNRNVWIGVAVVVIALIVWFAVKKHDENDVSQAQPQAITPNAVQVTEDTTAGSVDEPKTAGVAPVTMSYADALIKYKDARIQIGDQCVVPKPTDLTFKNNTNVMVDNRSDVTHTLKIGSTFSVKGYGFKIINLSAAKLPATWLVDCDGQQNVATVLIQK